MIRRLSASTWSTSRAAIVHASFLVALSFALALLATFVPTWLNLPEGDSIRTVLVFSAIAVATFASGWSILRSRTQDRERIDTLELVHAKEELRREKGQLQASLEDALERCTQLKEARTNLESEKKAWQDEAEERGSRLDVLEQSHRALEEACDVTTQGLHELEKAFQDAEREAVHKHAFLASVSEEMRSPAKAIQGITSLLRVSELDAEQANLLQAIDRSIERLMSMASDIVDYAKLDAGLLELEEASLELETTIGQALDVVAPNASARGIELMVDVAASTPDRVKGDPARLRQVLWSLMTHALETTRGDEVQVQVRGEQSPDHDRGQFEVTIDVCAKDVSVDRLAVAQKIAERMSGSLEAEATDDGTLLRLTFEAPIDGPLENEQATADVPDYQGRRALLLEPHPTSRAILAEMVERMGMTCLSVENEDAATAEISNLSSGDVAILATSFRDGVTFTPSLVDRLERAEVKVLLLLTPSSWEGPHRVGDVALPKPVRFRTLIEALESLSLPRTTKVDSQV